MLCRLFRVLALTSGPEGVLRAPQLPRLIQEKSRGVPPTKVQAPGPSFSGSPPGHRRGSGAASTRDGGSWQINNKPSIACRLFFPCFAYIMPHVASVPILSSQANQVIPSYLPLSLLNPQTIHPLDHQQTPPCPPWWTKNTVSSIPKMGRS